MLTIWDWNSILMTIEQVHSAKRIPERQYFHYTTPEGLLGIFNHYLNCHSDHISSCTFRASHIRFLNDAMEFNAGVKYLAGIENSSIEFAEDIFVISFCGEGDLLSQWKWYGKNSGIAIEFDLEHIVYQYWENSKGAERLPNIDHWTKPHPVLYTDQERNDYYDQIKKANMASHIKFDMTEINQELFVPFCKDKGFQEEKESRLAFFAPDGQEAGIRFPIKYYASNGMIKPTLEVKFTAQKGFDQNIIKGLTVGPGQNQSLIYNALIHMFDYNFSFEDNCNEHICSSGLVIRKSSIPFRS